jgi:transposase
MKSLSKSQTQHILSLLESGHSAHKISSSTGVHPSTISRLCSKHCPHLPKSFGGRPTKLSSTNINHAVHLIASGKVENAVQATKTLENIMNKPLSTETVCRHLKKAGMKAVVKKKMPLLTKRHRRERLTSQLVTRIGLWRTGRG